MPRLTVLEAYYGSGVILDYADDGAREAAFELCLSTIARMERQAESATYDLKWQSVGGTDMSRWHADRSRPVTLRLLRTFVTQSYRYFRMLCRVGSGEPYVFSVLSEDGSCVNLAPSWQAGNAWYDEFWATMWQTARDLCIDLVFPER